MFNQKKIFTLLTGNKRLLLAVLIIISVLGFGIGFSKHAYAYSTSTQGTQSCPYFGSNFLCDFYNTAKSENQSPDNVYLNFANKAALGATGSGTYIDPYVVKSGVNNIVDLKTGYLSQDGTDDNQNGSTDHSQDTLTWMNFEAGSQTLIGNVVATGTPNSVAFNTCLDLLYSGNLNNHFAILNGNPAYYNSHPYWDFSPYYNDSGTGSSGGVSCTGTIACGGSIDDSNPTCTPYESGIPGISAVWDQSGVGTPSSGNFDLKFTVNNPGKIALRTHVSFPTKGWTGWSPNADYLAQYGLRNVRAIYSGNTSNPGDDIYFKFVAPTCTPGQPGCPIPSSTSTSVTCGGASAYNAGEGIYQTPDTAPNGGGSWSSSQIGKDASTYTDINVWDGNGSQTTPNLLLKGVSPTGAPGSESGASPSLSSAPWVNLPYTQNPGTQNIYYTVQYKELALVHHLNPDGTPASNNGTYQGVEYGTLATAQTQPCYTATCTIQNVSGDGPGGLVISGGKVSFTVAVTNPANGSNGQAELPGILNGHQLSLTGTPGGNTSWGIDVAAIPASSTTTDNITMNVSQLDGPGAYGDGLATDSADFYPDYAGGFQLGPPCGRVSVDVYQPFTLDTNPVANFDGDPENPTDVYYTTNVINNSGSPLVRTSFSSTFTFSPSKSKGAILDDSYPNTTFDFGSGTEFNHRIWPIDKPIVAGNAYRACLTIPFRKGWVGQNGPADTTQTSDGGTFCNNAVEVNKPYFKTYGSGVLAGGAFSSAQSPDGLIDSWNNHDPTNGGFDYGGGSELANIATGNIGGYASAQQSTLDVRSPHALTFANTVNNLPDTDKYKPNIGGLYGGPLSLPDQTVNGTGTPWPWVAIPGKSKPTSGSYVYNGDLTINGATIAAGQNVYLQVNGKVQIKGDITYVGSGGGWSIMNNVSNVPSFIIKSTDSIYIDPSVGELDGLYEAQPNSSGTPTPGKIYTCGQNFLPMGQTTLYDSCNKQLTVYGSLDAATVNLMRTYGSLRDETPIPGSTTTTYTKSPGPQLGIVYTQEQTPPGIPGMKCTNIDPGGLPSKYAWHDNYLCLPRSSPDAFCWGNESKASPCTNCNLDYIDPPTSPYYTSLHGSWHNWALCGFPQFVNNNWFHFGSPPSSSTTLSQHTDYKNRLKYANTYSDSTPIAQSPGGSYCTLWYEDSDPTTDSSNSLIWENTYICEPLAPPVLTPHTVIIAGHLPDPLKCSNNGGSTSPRPTCAAEVFDFSPEFYLSYPNTGGGSQSSNSSIDIYNLPPVL